MRKNPKILLYDIETAHNILASFDLKTEYTPHTNILQERFIVCAAWQWVGKKRVHAVSLLDDPKRFRKNSIDDYHVVETLMELFGKADILIAHNGDQFDNKYVLARAIKHGLKPNPPVRTVDTYKIAKMKFKFNSNRLDYLGRFLGFVGKKETPPGLWLEVLRGSKKAIQIMVDYNKHDVVILKYVYERLLPFIPGGMSRELFGGIGCPHCGSTNIQSRGVHRAETRVYRRFQCQECVKWFRAYKPFEGAPKYRVL